ncbi:hypothetical protein [Streptomyces sp. NPDC051098]|uniref:hypothetical protein n=1 Tax=Streptomyces sp. NPDC051098 TaxID=3155411 RepID=UPI00342EB099
MATSNERVGAVSVAPPEPAAWAGARSRAPALRRVKHEAWSAESVSSMAAAISRVTPRYRVVHAT